MDVESEPLPGERGGERADLDALHLPPGASEIVQQESMGTAYFEKPPARGDVSPEIPVAPLEEGIVHVAIPVEGLGVVTIAGGAGAVVLLSVKVASDDSGGLSERYTSPQTEHLATGQVL